MKNIVFPNGFKGAAVRAAIAHKNKKDLVLILSDRTCVSVGLFTKNDVKAIPVIITKEHLKESLSQAILVNSGNANACLPKKSFIETLNCVKYLAKILKIEKEKILLASTGVIGKPLPVKRIVNNIPRLVNRLSSSSKALNEIGNAILTTDTFPKVITKKFYLSKNKVTLTAIAKGAGMIAPNLATMLVFFLSDINIKREPLKRALNEVTKKTFNCLTIDGDMSTNDTIIFLANAHANNRIIDKENYDYYKFKNVLLNMSDKLRCMIAEDAEGATKVIKIDVEKAKSEKIAEKIAKRIANSMLVKTSLWGEQFNWGRVVASCGSVMCEMDPSRLDVYYEQMNVVKNGIQRSNIDLNKIRKILKRKQILIKVFLNNGNKNASFVTCDLSPEYVKINGRYN